MLIEKNAKIEARGKSDRTAFHYAIRSRSKETVQALLNSGADADARNELGRNCIDYDSSLGCDDFFRRSMTLLGKEKDAVQKSGIDSRDAD